MITTTKWEWDTKDSVHLDLDNGDRLLVSRTGPMDPIWSIHLCLRQPNGRYHFKYRGGKNSLKVAQADALRLSRP